MSDRLRWLTIWVAATCPDCEYSERVEDPRPDEQKMLARRARLHARRTGHRVTFERGQVDVTRE